IPDPTVDLRGAAAALLSQAIRINTVNPPGNEKPLAQLYVDVLRHHGVEAMVVDTPTRNGDRRASAWARVRGNGRA
ncbi:MAG: hypothetical protein GWM90_09080, partial [Gemmatimonadetes bacterium]|nr:hypothetical protein [Gemmatimonadota bacterium]NIU74237.1 hypothetical protein [Gammaproteobacteria bacterium]NIX44263.1 hypothetical protein [Gemmatimonadota bacterium]